MHQIDWDLWPGNRTGAQSIAAFPLSTAVRDQNVDVGMFSARIAKSVPAAAARIDYASPSASGAAPFTRCPGLARIST